MAISFAEKLETIVNARNSDLGLLIAPRMSILPLPFQSYDDPFFPYGRAIVDATLDLVCAYMFDLASYLMLGAAGAIALERTIAYVGRDALTILHGPFLGPDFANITDETAFAVDAVTLTDSQFLDAYLRRPDRGALLVRTGYSTMLDAPDTSGFYWQDAQLFTLPGSDGQILHVRLVSLNEVEGEDFAERLRVQLEKIRES